MAATMPTSNPGLAYDPRLGQTAQFWAEFEKRSAQMHGSKVVYPVGSNWKPLRIPTLAQCVKSGNPKAVHV